MIEKMRKLSLLMLSSDTDDFLSELQKLGVVHLESEHFAESEELATLQDSILTLKKTESHLHDFKETEKQHKVKVCTTAEELTEEVDRLVAELAHLHVRREALHKEAEQIEHWGEFDPELIAKLEEQGICISFFSLAQKKFAELDLSAYTSEVINNDHKQVYFVILSEGKTSLEALGLQEEQRIASWRLLQTEKAD
jgi:V/A-type H+/Na+-transporting ATPase subunit I